MCLSGVFSAIAAIVRQRVSGIGPGPRCWWRGSCEKETKAALRDASWTCYYVLSSRFGPAPPYYLHCTGRWGAISPTRPSVIIRPVTYLKEGQPELSSEGSSSSSPSFTRQDTHHRKHAVAHLVRLPPALGRLLQVRLAPERCPQH